MLYLNKTCNLISYTRTPERGLLLGFHHTDTNAAAQIPAAGQRYVAMLDILGFRRLVATASAEDIASRLRRLIDRARERESEWIELRGKHHQRSVVWTGIANFSDTILLWTQPQESASPFLGRVEQSNFLMVVASLLVNGFRLGLPMRAGVAFGETYVDQTANIILGQAVVDAYDVEQAQEWVGGALHPECRFRPSFEVDSILVKYQVPTKPGTPFSLDHAIDWTCWTQPTYIPSWDTYDFREQLLDAFVRYSEADIPENARPKYKNAKAFADKRYRSNRLLP